MQVTVNHSLPTAEAKQRVEKFSEHLKQQFPNDASNITQTWDGDTCTVSGKVKGISFTCTLHVSDADVTANGDLPFFARPFQGAIESAIRNGLEQAMREKGQKA